jgi:LysM repeat protein/ABC-type branched-subunit amino acid transport system substrate-binding protein
MKNILCLIVIFQFLLFIPAFAQQKAPSKSVSVSNEKYETHKILKGETVFSICKKYNCDEKDLRAANPQLVNGLKTGETLNIPVPLSVKSQKSTVKDEFIYHVTKKGETLFSLSKLYNIPTETIIQFNPEVKQGVKVKQTIRIPKLSGKIVTEELTDTKKEQVEKENFTQHEVEQGETFFSLQRRYEVTKEQLLELNPGLKDGLQVGENIKIPSDKIKNEESKPDKNAYIEHVVEPGETIYSISAKHNVKEEDIRELNPELKERGLISGETIYISKTGNKNSFESNSEKTLTNEVSVTDKKEVPQINKNEPSKSYFKKDLPNLSRDTFRITMFLPLFLNQNISNNLSSENTEESDVADSTQNSNSDEYQANSGRSLYSKSKNFVSFYEGFLIALDTMKKSGINIRLDLYDNQLKQAVVDSVIRHSDLVNSDLIIGPVDVKLQKNISFFSNKNQIPMVSPFSSDDDYTISNSFYYQINPTKDFILRKTADYIGKEYCDKNVIIFAPGSYEQIKGADLVETVRDRIKYYASKKKVSSGRFTIININEGYWEVKNSLKADEENIVYIPPSNNRTEREAILSKAINSLYVLSEEYKITLVGMNDYPTFKSINTEYFHKLNLHFVTPNFIDYQEPEVKSFIKNYRNKFLTEPNPFSYRGYDIAKFFIEAYRENGRNFTKKITSFKTNTIQSNFRPKRLKEFSGFMNSSLFVVNYTPEYEVKVASIISE